MNSSKCQSGWFSSASKPVRLFPDLVTNPMSSLAVGPLVQSHHGAYTQTLARLPLLVPVPLANRNSYRTCATAPACTSLLKTILVYDS